MSELLQLFALVVVLGLVLLGFNWVMTEHEKIDGNGPHNNDQGRE